MPEATVDEHRPTLAAIGDVEEMLDGMRLPIRNVPLSGLVRASFDVPAPALTLVARAA